MEQNAIKNQTPEKSAETTISRDYDEMRLRKFMEDARANQNLSMAILGGAAAAALGAVLWGVITYVTAFQIGWMAVGVGFLVGYVVQRLGQGVDTSFGIIGALLALGGCMMGNLFASCIAISQQYQIGLGEVLATLNLPIVVDIMTQTFNPIDLLFYAIAVYEGYRFSFRRISDEELAAVLKH
jgi:mannose/fructose/N-acetylgalactosamine-specific phosphotransferase system component IID